MIKNVAEFYDEYVDKQKEIYISTRNEKIQEYSERFGLKANHKVLEIGCGIGTQTKLLADFAIHGQIHAVDISPKSIEEANKAFEKYNNVRFYTGDFCSMLFAEKDFDFVVLPDVIEHIPMENHLEFFKRIRNCIKNNASILINIPNPNYLEWCIKHKPELLQIIDQPIYTEALVKSTYPNDLFIHYLETYEIWTKGSDYQLIILKVKSDQNKFEFIPINNTYRGRLKNFISNILK